MRLKELTLKNYRQYKDNVLKFDENSLTVYVGVMGTGKTNILNAVFWCLYDEEPFLSKQYDKLARLNTITADNLKENEEATVSVQLLFKAEDVHIRFEREEKYIMKDNKIFSKNHDRELKALIPNVSTGNNEIYYNEDASDYVEKLIPEDIRSHFFFDGEKLDKYFREQSGSDIKKAIVEVSQISLLDEIERKINYVKGDLRRQAGDLDPKVHEMEQKLNEIDSNIKESITNKEKKENQLDGIKGEIKKLEEYLDDKPNVKEIKAEINDLNRQLEQKGKILNEKEQEKKEILYENSKIIYLYEPLINFKDYVEKHKGKDYPITNDRKLIENVLDKRTCICGTDVEPESTEEIELNKLLDQIELSSDVIMELTGYAASVDSFTQNLERFKKDIHRINDDIENLNEEKNILQDKISRGEKKILGFDEEEIVQMYEELNDYKKMKDKNHEIIGGYKIDIERQQKEYKKYEEKFEKELKKQEQHTELYQQLNFIDNALDILQKSRESILIDIKHRVKEEFNNMFFKLMWKIKTYSHLDINDENEIKVFNDRGNSCLGSFSGGEREVLALSFTLALQSVSGFEAPIIIDRPYAMVSGEPIHYITEILKEIAKKKQIILLITPNDFKEVQSKLIDYSTIFNLELEDSEREVKVKG